MSLQIIINGYSHTEVTRSSDQNDKWDADDLYHDHSVDSFSLSDNNYGDLTISFIPKPDVDYYLLYGRYGTGDSFHHEDGLIEYIGLYDDKDIAWENYRTLENNEEYSVILTADNGLKYSQSVPWVGYFESLSGLEVQTIRLVVDNY